MKGSLLGISGKMGAGKDRLFHLIQKAHPNARNVKFANALKHIVALLAHVDPSYCYTDEGKQMVIPHCNNRTLGALQQDIGEGFRQQFGEDVWLTPVIEDCVKTQGVLNVITDVRYWNEANAIRARGGIIICVTQSNSKKLRNDGRDFNHISECEMDDYSFDAFIDFDTMTEEEILQKVNGLVFG